MKPFIIASAALLALTPFTGVKAAVLDPMKFAQSYCLSRQSGSSTNESTERAVLASIDNTRQAIKTTDGTDLDVKLSWEAVTILCPGYISD